MNILLYYPSNVRTIPIDLPLLELQKRGHHIYLLTTESKGTLHELYEEHNVETYANKYISPVKLYNYVRQIIFLVNFCRKHKIDNVHSHLQQSNVIAVVANFFTRSKVIVFRHHCKFHDLVPNSGISPSRNEMIGDQLINRLSSHQIVPSKAVMENMVKYEKVRRDNIQVIPYIYEFDKMVKLDANEVSSIRDRFKAKLLIIMVSRLTPFKRHMEALQPIARLIKEGLDIQLLIMDDGPESETLKKFVDNQTLSKSIHFLGFQYDILNYISASDIIVHPSLTDASNSAIKEAAILEKIAIVCDGVGDFNDYIKHDENGFLLDARAFQKELLELIPNIYSNMNNYQVYGQRLKNEVVKKFCISESIIDMYENL